MILHTAITNLKGIGPYYAAILHRYDVRTCLDLLWMLPTKWTTVEAATILHPDQPVVANLLITSVIRSKKGTRKLILVTGSHCSGRDVLVTFFADSKLFYVGNRICVFGQLKIAGDKLTMSHPQWKPGHHANFTETQYPIAGIPPAILTACITRILEHLTYAEWLPTDLLQKKGWPDFVKCFRILHSDQSQAAKAVARQRLVFDEALAYQYALHNARQTLATHSEGYALPLCETDDLLGKFGHDLTQSQHNVWSEVAADLASPHRTMRLIYGDVGSGKTIIALRAMVMCYRGGQQAALLAPTTILAKQHYQLLQVLAPDIPTVFLTGKTKSKVAHDTIAHENCIVIGTHALLQDQLQYKSLGLLVIDEQHRFGVLQRMAIDQSLQYNILLMTATPIPRTYQLLMSGSIPVSKITTRPQSHRDIEVRLVPYGRLPEILEDVRALLAGGDSIYWVCPFIAPSPRHGMDVKTRAGMLREVFGDLVGIMHGQLTVASKDEMLERFFDKQIRILVSTTVIEVGINIPHANTIIIENAELFGIAQLYQLLGRVGRGTEPGRCYLVHKTLSQDARRRLSALRECRSGLDLAEHDAYIRGFGNILGTEQSGRSYFRILKPDADMDLLEEAAQLVESDPPPELLDVFGYLYKPWYCG